VPNWFATEGKKGVRHGQNFAVFAFDEEGKGEIHSSKRKRQRSRGDNNLQFKNKGRTLGTGKDAEKCLNALPPAATRGKGRKGALQEGEHSYISGGEGGETSSPSSTTKRGGKVTAADRRPFSSTSNNIEGGREIHLQLAVRKGEGVQIGSRRAAP